MTNKITVPVLFGEKEELYNYSISYRIYNEWWMIIHQLLKILLTYEKKYGKYYDLFLDILHELHEICSVIGSAWSVIKKRNGLCTPCPAPDTHAHYTRNRTPIFQCKSMQSMIYVYVGAFCDHVPSDYSHSQQSVLRSFSLQVPWLSL